MAVLQAMKMSQMMKEMEDLPIASPKDQLTPGELLPGDADSKWSESVPSGQGELSDQNFLTGGYHVGVNTVGQTLRNANRQIRSEPPNPQVKVSHGYKQQLKLTPTEDLSKLRMPVNNLYQFYLFII